MIAFDMSVTCVGWCLFLDREPINYGKFVFKSTAKIGEKLAIFAEFLRDLFEAFAPDEIVVEKPLNRRGSTTARHYELLGVLRLVWLELQAAEIPKEAVIDPKTVKTVMGVQRVTGDHDKNKELMVCYINKLFGLKLKYDKHSPRKSDDDVADAIAVGETYLRSVRGVANV
jgi:Holliday junction resolvasome RuvABC endonuclease subunit